MSVISRQELLDLKALMVSEKSVFGGCLIHEDVIQKSHEYEMSLLTRAEKAEAKLKASEEARQNAVLCMMEANHLALEDQARAEKAEAKLKPHFCEGYKAGTTAHNTVGDASFHDAEFHYEKFVKDKTVRKDEILLLKSRVEKAEAQVAELKKLSSHGNGEILLGWMNAHKKAMDRLEKAEAECKRLRGLADLAIVAMQNGDFKKAETHLMPMLIRLEI